MSDITYAILTIPAILVMILCEMYVEAVGTAFDEWHFYLNRRRKPKPAGAQEGRE